MAHRDRYCAAIECRLLRRERKSFNQLPISFGYCCVDRIRARGITDAAIRGGRIHALRRPSDLNTLKAKGRNCSGASITQEVRLIHYPHIRHDYVRS